MLVGSFMIGSNMSACQHVTHHSAYMLISLHYLHITRIRILNIIFLHADNADSTNSVDMLTSIWCKCQQVGTVAYWVTWQCADMLTCLHCLYIMLNIAQLKQQIIAVIYNVYMMICLHYLHITRIRILNIIFLHADSTDGTNSADMLTMVICQCSNMLTLPMCWCDNTIKHISVREIFDAMSAGRHCSIMGDMVMCLHADMPTSMHIMLNITQLRQQIIAVIYSAFIPTCLHSLHVGTLV